MPFQCVRKSLFRNPYERALDFSRSAAFQRRSWRFSSLGSPGWQGGSGAKGREEQEGERERFNGRTHGNARGAVVPPLTGPLLKRRRRRRSCWRLLQLPLGRDSLPSRSPGSHWRLPRPSRCYSSRAPAPGPATPRLLLLLCVLHR